MYICRSNLSHTGAVVALMFEENTEKSSKFTLFVSGDMSDHIPSQLPIYLSTNELNCGIIQLK